MRFPLGYRNSYRNASGFVSSNEHLVMFAAFFALAVAARVVFQPLPSVDPLLPIILFAGARLGTRDGALFGATSYYASNFFVIGGQGIWTIPMVVGAAGVGACGAMFKNKLLGIAVGTVFYEIVVNIALAFMFNPLLALPFAAVHFVSNLAFVAVGEKVLRRIQARSQAATPA